MGYESWTAEVEFTPGVWTDVTSRVDTTETGGGPFVITAGDTPEASEDPGGLSLPLRNHDQALTPLNVLSPYYPNVVPGKRCRIRDTIADQVIPLFTGYLQFPEIDSWAASNAAAPRDQIIRVPFVDLVTYMDTRTFGSAHTEHVRYYGGSDLKGFWPLTNDAAPFNGVGPFTAAATVVKARTGGSIPLIAVAQPSSGDAPPGAEGSGLRCTVVTDPTSVSRSYQQVVSPATFRPAIGSADTVTIVFWFSHQTVDAASGFQEIFSTSLIGSGTVSLTLDRDTTTGFWTLTASGAQSGTIAAGGGLGTDALMPVAIRYSASAPNMELWVGSVRLTATPTGAAPTGLTLQSMLIGFQIGAYDLSSWQVYIGQSWGYTDYLTQIKQAYDPLGQQSTGARIRQALAYAGIDLPTYRINTGAAVMQSETLLGRKPSDIIQDAVTTEQGEFYASPDGLPVFADRLTLYNV